MASGPSHYKDAEGLLAWVENLAATDEVSVEAIQIVLAQAMIHATLADAAATAASLLVDGRELPNGAWREVTR